MFHFSPVLFEITFHCDKQLASYGQTHARDAKCLSRLPDFNQKWNVSSNVRKTPQYQKFIKTHSVVDAYVRTDWRTETESSACVAERRIFANLSLQTCKKFTQHANLVAMPVPVSYVYLHKDSSVSKTWHLWTDIQINKSREADSCSASHQ